MAARTINAKDQAGGTTTRSKQFKGLYTSIDTAKRRITISRQLLWAKLYLENFEKPHIFSEDAARI